MEILPLFLALGSVYAYKLPDGLKSCHKSDPNFNECFKDALTDGFSKFANGYKPLGIPQLNPIAITEITSELSSGLKQTLKNIKLSGLAASKVTMMKADFDGLTMDFDVEIDHAEIDADYTMKGKLVTFELDTSGKCKITVDGIIGRYKTKLERFEKDGKKYLKFVEWKVHYEPKSVHYYFENIVPGNKQLSDIILQTVNDNALEIFQDFAPTLEEAFAQVHKMVSNIFYEKIPENEIFLP